MNRKKLLIGTYCIAPYCRTDAHIKALADCGIDYITAAPYERPFLDLCAKYGVEAVVNYLPGWWGGDGDNAGQFSEKISEKSYEQSAAKFEDHPAICGMDVGDEPNALDFPHYGKMIKKAKELFPDKLIYLNLYPNYANEKQLGTKTYAEHIDSYVRNTDLDYICLDHYLYCHDNFGRDIDNMSIVADACRESGRDFWIVLQVNSNHENIFTSEKQLRLQAYSALAFGVRTINWACWTAGWWSNNVVNKNGNITEQYYKLKRVNAGLKALSPVYMKYKNQKTVFLGKKTDFTDRLQTGNGSFGDVFEKVTVNDAESTLLAGYSEKKNGAALMLTNVTDPMCVRNDTIADVSFSVKAGMKVKAYYLGKPIELSCRDGIYSLKIENADGVFITAES